MEPNNIDAIVQGFAIFLLGRLAVKLVSPLSVARDASGLAYPLRDLEVTRRVGAARVRTRDLMGKSQGNHHYTDTTSYFSVLLVMFGSVRYQ
jgi:hypothetical protein